MAPNVVLYTFAMGDGGGRKHTIALSAKSLLENATHCGASLSERLKSVVGFLQLLKTVSLPRTCPFSQYQDSVIGERIEVYTNCELL